MEELKQQLIEFFKESQNYQPYFKRKLYEEAFQKFFAEQRELLATIIELCEKAEDKDKIIDEIASVIPAFVHSKINEQTGKRKKESLVMDYNMNVVTFVIPVLTYSRNEYCDAVADKLVEHWNDGPVTMKIQKSNYEDLQNSFRNRLCYITTAVCESQNKPDHCYELNLLRKYRDDYLLGSPSGTALVERYYDIAPTIVSRINKEKNKREIYETIYNTYLSPCLLLIEQNRNEECQEVYTKMVTDLQKRYLYQKQEDLHERLSN